MEIRHLDSEMKAVQHDQGARWSTRQLHRIALHDCLILR